MTDALPRPAARSRPRLSWTDGAGSHVIELRDARTAGSAPGCDLILSDRAVSRLHAELAPRDDGLWIRDLGSKNGTFVGGVKIHEARVPAGATIRLGTTEIAVNYDAPAVPERVWPSETFGPLVGRSAVMREVFAHVGALAATDTSVLFVGEAGSGKSTLARALHERSPRAGAPFVVVDCAALPEPVAAAEILEQALTTAEGGTILFAEPQELPFILQRELVPPLDARVFRAIATTTRDLRPLVNQGAFREALYFRLAGATVNVPPLRDRLDDLPLLFRHFLEDDAAMATPSVLDDLARLPWTGNVQEVRNYAARMRASGGPIAAFPEYDDEVDSVNDFGAEVATVEMPILDPATLAAFEGAAPPNDMRLPGGLEPWFVTGFKEFREKWIELGEREYLRRLMARTNRSSGTAAREAGLERTYLYRLIKKHGV